MIVELQRLLRWSRTYIPLLLFFIINTTHTRSVHRPQDYPMPRVTTQWQGCDKTYSIQDWHLEEFPIFKTYDEEFFKAHMLPAGSITFRNHPEKVVPTSVLNNLIEELLLEVDKKKKHFTHFKVLTRKNFNRRKKCGMMTLKFNDYPFILKLFIETPKTLMNPNCKGMDNVWFFRLGGGANRHFAGFTRIKNLEINKQRIANSPYWSTFVDFPRKWFWISKNTQKIVLTGYHVGPQSTIANTIPGTYAIIADAIECSYQYNNKNIQDTHTALALCNYLENWIDAHIDNFMIEKETGKLIVIDTEHFPTFVGMKEKRIFNSYFEWFTYLAGKCAHDWFFRTKKERLALQTAPNSIIL